VSHCGGTVSKAMSDNIGIVMEKVEVLQVSFPLRTSFAVIYRSKWSVLVYLSSGGQIMVPLEPTMLQKHRLCHATRTINKIGRVRTG
jgi:hypothetical protein